MTLLELCVDDSHGVRLARDGGAARVELCVDLWCGGLTPPLSMVKEALPLAPREGIHLLIREKADSFILTESEVEGLCARIEEIRSIEKNLRGEVPVGFVVGAITADGGIDAQASARFRAAAGEAPLTFHRAFDTVNDRKKALEQLIDQGYQRVLTTGGHPTTADPTRLRALVEQAGDRLIVLGSGGLRSHNVHRVVAEAGLSEVHLRAPAPGGGTSASEIRRVVQALQR